MKLIIFIFAAILDLGWVSAAPRSLVLFSPPPPMTINAPERSSDEKEGPGKALETPIIYQFDIHSNISNRYAKTLVTSKVKNTVTKAKEASFTVILPEKAFISEFIMVIDGKSYKAYVKEKEEAKNIYDKAVQSGQSAAHVSASARDSNRFTVSVNIEPEKKATFLLTYEELLERTNDQYELIMNIHPGQIVKNMNIEVFVNESRPLKFVRTPSLRSGNEISKNDDRLNPNTDINIINSTRAHVAFKPNVDQQRRFAKSLGVKENEGVAGQFVLQYDVERDPRNGEVLVQDGYFVHFFAPTDLKPLPKHVVFVLDTSGSMFGTKLKQLKEAMVSILDDLSETDVFHIVEFNTYAYVWNIENQERILAEIKTDIEDLYKKQFPLAMKASKEAIEKGKKVIEKFQDDALTDILSSLQVALHLVDVNVKRNKDAGTFHQPIVVFLTDGEPTVGVSYPEEITSIITKMNKEKNQVPIFSLSFGDGVDRKFLRKMSLKNQGFSRHIYEASDAALQLEEFYKQISSPLLSNVNFKYTSEVKDVTKAEFPIYFKGCELVSAGRIDEGMKIDFVIEGSDLNGVTKLPSVVEEPVASLERLWAYLTIKKKLEERELAENQTELTKEALDLALKYSFVTDVSSLVVVKPNDTSTVNTEDASRTDDDSDLVLQSLSGGRQSVLRFDDDDLDSDVDSSYLVQTLSEPNPAMPLSTRQRLPWLDAVLNANDTFAVKGALLELGDGINFIPVDDCIGTPTNATETGKCTLIHRCAHVFPLLRDLATYEKFSCQLKNRYAGVCCPIDLAQQIVPVP